MKKTVLRLIGATALAVSMAACAEVPAEKTADSNSQPQIETGDESIIVESEEPEVPEADEDPGVMNVGDTATVGGWDVTITKVVKNANANVAAFSDYGNEKAKFQYVLVEYTGVYNGSERTADVTSDLTWTFGGTDGVVYDSTYGWDQSDEESWPTEARKGGNVKDQMVFDVPVKAIDGGVVSVEGYTEDFDTVYADFTL